MAMAVAVDTARLALHYIPKLQRELDCATGGRRRFQIHRVSVHATIPIPDSEFLRQSHSVFRDPKKNEVLLPEQEALDWQADLDDDLGDAAVLHHLHQQAATVPLLSSVISQSDHGNAVVTTLTGCALSASINAATQGRLLSSFHRHSVRRSCVVHWKSALESDAILTRSNWTALFPSDLGIERSGLDFCVYDPASEYEYIVWEEYSEDIQLVFWQLQLDVVDLFSWRTLPTSRPGKRRRTAFNQFLQVSDSPVVEDASRRNSLPHARRFNGVRHRPDRRTWVAEMKPPKHKTKQDFGNFKSEAEAARAVDAAFHHYGKPDLLNFPDTSLSFLSTRPTAPPGLDEKAKVKFVKEEAKLLLAATVATSLLHSTHTNSRRSPSGQFRPLPQISSPFTCSGLDDAVSQPLPWVLLDSICDISTPGVQNNLETSNSVQNAEQGWDWAKESSTQAAPPNVVNPRACEIPSMWLDSLIQSPLAPMYSRSPSPSRFEEEIMYALLSQQSLST